MRHPDLTKPILVINRSFWPDIEATGQFLTELCEKLAEHHPIMMLAGRSYFVPDLWSKWKLFRKETHGRIQILRIRHTLFWKGSFTGRTINWLTFTLLAFIAAWRIHPPLIIANTDPPFLVIMAWILKRLKGIPYIFNCRDLYPDAALELGKLRPGFVSRCFDWIHRRAIRSALLIIPLGRSMAERIRGKGIDGTPIRIIPDWANTTLIHPVPKRDNPLLKDSGLENRFIIMYSGNLGLSQDFGPILEALAKISSSLPWQLVFIGDGSGKAKLEQDVLALNLKNVLFLPYQPKEKLAFSLSLADLHLVPLQKGMSGASVPSKVYGIMAAGRPFLAVTDKGSEPARLALDFQCGFWAPPGDVEKISQAIHWSLYHTEELEEMGRRARRLAEERFDKDVVIAQWQKVLEEFFPLKEPVSPHPLRSPEIHSAAN